MIKILNDSILLDEGEKVDVPNRILLANNKLIKCKGEINSYVELQDKLIILIDTYHASNLFKSLSRNIFCYNKIDGSLKWQVESKEGSPYVGIDLGIKKESGEVLYGERGVITREGEWGKIESCTYLTKPFQHGSDCISAQTFSSGFYSVDIETGKVTFLYRDK